jgi:hypothetical protein
MHITTRHDTEPGVRAGMSFKSKEGRRLVIIIIIALVLIAGLWAWKTIQINNIRNQAEQEQLELNKKAIAQIRKIDEVNLKLLAKPLVWAIRTEMLNNNVNQVALYINEIVRQNNFRKISVIDGNGIVMLSTDKKEEGKAFGLAGSIIDLSSNNTLVANLNDTMMVMTSPIMGFNNRLGTLNIIYSAKQPMLID